jgi:hypothetical protein
MAIDGQEDLVMLYFYGVTALVCGLATAIGGALVPKKYQRSGSIAGAAIGGLITAVDMKLHT